MNRHLLRTWIAALALSAPLGAQATTIIFVRHGEKLPTAGPDPDLTDAGRARAESLRVAMKDRHLTIVLATPYVRTVQTAMPAAKSAGLTVTPIPVAGGLPAYIEAVREAVDKAPGGTALVVSHSNTIAPLMKAFGAPAMGDLCDDEYEAMFVLERKPGEAPSFTRMTVGALDPPGAHACHGR
jgi:phosphohistidine phosphatase SixA